MKIGGGYDIDAWYQSFARAVISEGEAARRKLESLAYSEQGVPVVLPMASPFEIEACYQGTTESLIQELALHTLLGQAAKDPDDPTTGEVADAETLVAAIAFRLVGFPLDLEAGT